MQAWRRCELSDILIKCNAISERLLWLRIRWCSAAETALYRCRCFLYSQRNGHVQLISDSLFSNICFLHQSVGTCCLLTVSRWVLVIRHQRKLITCLQLRSNSGVNSCIIMGGGGVHSHCTRRNLEAHRRNNVHRWENSSLRKATQVRSWLHGRHLTAKQRSCWAGKRIGRCQETASYTDMTTSDRHCTTVGSSVKPPSLQANPNL
jgi:hypothetical protein